MKGIDIFCASQSATAISLTMDQPSSSSTTTLHGGGSRSPAIDRCNPIITDSRRTARPPAPPPLIPKPQRSRVKKKNKQIIHKENGDQAKKHETDKEIDDKISSSNGGAVRKSWSCTKPGNFISPPGSTRYLLSEKVLVNALSDGDVKMNESFDEKPPSSSPPPNQVVVLRVSLHCRGCERKMRKHISRMEGVTSFNIDFAAKKVTVTGNITPLEVISSISKVKNAQLWSPTVSSSSSTSSPINIQSNSELKNHELRGTNNNNAWVMDKGAFVGLAS